MKDRWNTAIDLVKGYIRSHAKDRSKPSGIISSWPSIKIKEFFTSGWESVKTTVQGVWDTIGSYIEDPINTAKRCRQHGDRHYQEPPSVRR